MWQISWSNAIGRTLPFDCGAIPDDVALIRALNQIVDVIPDDATDIVIACEHDVIVYDLDEFFAYRFLGLDLKEILFCRDAR